MASPMICKLTRKGRSLSSKLKKTGLKLAVLLNHDMLRFLWHELFGMHMFD